MNNFETYKQFIEYVENNYKEADQLIIEDFIAYYINDFRGYGKYNCKNTYKNNLLNDNTGKLHKMALIGFEFEKKIFEKNNNDN